jgi:tripartite-type tricarboxylate transporter receptor subunit TctC
VQIIVPFGPGGGQDILARSFNNELGAALGQPVIVEYRAGAGGMVGSSFVAKSDPNAQTMLIGSIGHTVGALLSAKPPYHPVNDFTPVAHVALSNQVIIVNATLPVKSARELVGYVRANPGKFNYASAGTGSSTHLAMAYLASVAGIQMEHIPYKSNADQIAALLAGTVQVISMPIIATMPVAKDPRIRILGVTPSKRSRILPDVPTIAESGLPEYTYEPAWFGLLGPAGMPRPFVERVSQEMARLVNAPTLSERLAKLGLEPLYLDPAAFTQVLRADYEKIGRIVKLAGVTAE